MGELLTIDQLQFLEWGPYSFSVEPASVLCLSGDSGSGKSLLLRAITDLIPSQGKCAIGEKGRETMKGPEWRRHVRLLPAESAWWADQVAAHFPDDYNWEALGDLGFENDVQTWDIGRLSSGEKQRLGLARALARPLAALLLDEPSANLDDRSAERVETFILDFQKQVNCPIIWVSHDVEQIKRVASKWYRMEDKKLSLQSL